MKELESVRSGLLADMPHKVIDYRMLDVLEALDKRLDALEKGDELSLGDIRLRLRVVEQKVGLDAYADDYPGDKKTCGECKHPFQKVGVPDYLLCLRQCSVHTARLRSDQACPNFKALP
jgi:hypothetical protein